jgi:hypothetical protein
MVLAVYAEVSFSAKPAAQRQSAEGPKWVEFRRSAWMSAMGGKPTFAARDFIESDTD